MKCPVSQIVSTTAIDPVTINNTFSLNDMISNTPGRSTVTV
jgi:hypothetical protein